jgi:DNA-binding CsgD family transcriptional regulator
MKNLLPREKECLYWVARGKTSEEIALILEIKPSTVRHHLREVRTKLNCPTIAACVYRGITLALI